MKKQSIYWLTIVPLTILPIIIDNMLSETQSKHYPFIWSIFLIPCILVMIMYPKWKVVLWLPIFYGAIKYITEFSQTTPTDKSESIALFSGSVINWTIHLTMGYFIIKSHKLLLEVEQLTITDPLTEIYNRRYFDLFLEKSIPLSQRMNSSLIMMFLDIDHFKKINDNYGHQCGDEALKHISRIIKNNVRKSDAYVRYGGEEFAVILQNTKLDEGKILAERIRDSIENYEFTYKNERVLLTASIGLSLYKGGKVEELIENTDKALYRAKENGRNQIDILNF